MTASNGITGVGGFKVGHYTNADAATGCTVVLCETGAVGGVDVRGSSPGTRETDLLHPTNRIDDVYAVLLSGGSASAVKDVVADANQAGTPPLFCKCSTTAREGQWSGSGGSTNPVSSRYRPSAAVSPLMTG